MPSECPAAAGPCRGPAPSWGLFTQLLWGQGGAQGSQTGTAGPGSMGMSCQNSFLSGPSGDRGPAIPASGNWLLEELGG